MYLLDSNVYLEILLNQEKKEICKNFLDSNVGNLYISDFSLHSIGVILFRNDKDDVFLKFVNDTIPKVKIITLLEESYKDLPEIKEYLNLDFDDSYQYKIAKDNNLEIVTMNGDFENVKHMIKVNFL